MISFSPRYYDFSPRRHDMPAAEMRTLLTCRLLRCRYHFATLHCCLRAFALIALLFIYAIFYAATGSSILTPPSSLAATPP